MKIKKILFLAITLFAITNCGNNTDLSLSTSSINQTTPLTSSNIATPKVTTNNTSKDTTKPSSTTNKVTSVSSNTTVSKPWEEGRTLLDCGYYQMDLPKNHLTPYNLKTTLSADDSSWSNNDMKEYLPSGFRYIYKNACDDGPAYHKASAKFYSSNNKAPGGLKIDNTGVGFQSSMFTHTGAKLEIRIGISQVNNASDKPEEGKDTFHIYFFNKEGKYLNKYIVEEKTITTNTKEIKFYWTENASEIAYFEFRCNAMPYKGQQCYNIGISYCNFKSWERI